MYPEPERMNSYLTILILFMFIFIKKKKMVLNLDEKVSLEGEGTHSKQSNSTTTTTTRYGPLTTLRLSSSRTRQLQNHRQSIYLCFCFPRSYFPHYYFYLSHFHFKSRPCLSTLLGKLEIRFPIFS